MRVYPFPRSYSRIKIPEPAITPLNLAKSFNVRALPFLESSMTSSNVIVSPSVNTAISLIVESSTTLTSKHTLSAPTTSTL